MRVPLNSAAWLCTSHVYRAPYKPIIVVGHGKGQGIKSGPRRMQGVAVESPVKLNFPDGDFWDFMGTSTSSRLPVH